MKKCLLYFFSGTGNTALAGEMLKNNLTKYGYEVTSYQLKAPYNNVPSPDGYDLIGLGYPIHAFNVPEVFARFIKKLPKLSKQTKTFIFKVSGEPYHLNDASSFHIFGKLKRKGYKVVMEKHLLMPYNIMFRYPDGVAKQMYLYLNSLTELVAKRLSLGEEEKTHFGLGYIVLSFILRIEWIAPKLNCLFSSVDRKKCTNCHMCINNCPTNSMYINKKGRIKINSSCSMCMKCTYSCPTNAIRFGFMNSWKVNGPYNYKKIVNDKSIKPDYINRKTKDYFRHFKEYFHLQNELLIKYDIEPPVKYKYDETLLGHKEEKNYLKSRQ